MNELRKKLLKIMAGTSAQKWIDRRDLLAKTGASEQQLDAMLLALHEERAINRAQVIRGDTVIHAIWITGVIAKIPRSQFTINPNKRPQFDPIVRPTEDKEKTVKESEQKTAVTTKHIRDLVIVKPGILREDVYKALVFSDGSNKKKVGDLISCLISTKQLTQNDEGGKKRLHPGPNINGAISRNHSKKPKSEPKQKKPAAKLLTGEDAKPFQQVSRSVGNEKPIANSDTHTGSDAPAIPEFLLKKTPPTAPAAGDTPLINHLSAVASAVPPGVILGVFRDKDGITEITFDTKAGASFNVGGSLEDAVRCIYALAVVQNFAEG